MQRSHVIEDAINNNMKSLLFCLFYKCKKLLVGVRPSPCGGVEQILGGLGLLVAALLSKRIVNMNVISGVVFVRSAGLEHGQQIQGIHTQLF